MPPARPSVSDLLQQGLHLHQSGQGREAARYYEQVLARMPDQPAANHLLGLVRLQTGNPAEAVTLISRAIRGNRKDPNYHCNLGVALNAAGRPAEAMEAFDRALALKPGYAEALSNRGMALRALGRSGEAAESYRKALLQRPEEPGFHFNLANALADDGDWLGAVDSYRQALKLRPRHGQAIFGLASSLAFLTRYAEAEAEVRAGLRLLPDDPELHYRLGRALYQQLDLEGAIAAMRRAIALRPTYGEAHQQLSVMIRHHGPDGDIEAMERLLDDPALPPSDRVFIGFGLGKALADIGEHARSVTIFDAANRLQRSQLSYSVDSAVSDLLETSRPFRGLELPPPADDDLGAGIIFIVGLPRSGKTSIETALAQHPDVHAAGELKAFEHLVRRPHPGAPSRFDPAEPGRSEIRWLGERYMSYVRAVAPGQAFVTDTLPGNFRNIGLIRLALPRAKVILARREPVGHRIAMYEKLFAGASYEFTYDIGELVRYETAVASLVDDWDRMFPGFVHAVDAAALAGDRETVMRSLLQFCGLPWADAVLLPVESEPQWGEFGPDALAANRAAHRAAWLAVHPELTGA